VLHTYAAARVPVDDPERVAVRNLLLKNLKTAKFSPSGLHLGFLHLHAIGQLYDVADGRLERPRILDSFVKAGPAQFQIFSRVATVSPTLLRKLSLTRKTRLDCDDKLVAEAIQFLQQESLLPVLVDEEVWDDAGRISFEMTGAWLDVTEALLEKTKYRFEPLGSSMLWIGSPERATRFREMLIRGQEKAAFASERVISALSEKTTIEFIETPVIDVADYLEDLHGITIEVFGDIADKSISRDIRGVPLYLALELVCADAKFNWGTIDEIVAFGSDEEIRKLNGLKRERLRRWARLRPDDGKVAEALQENTSLEFIETPLVDVVDYLSDLHDIPIRLTDAKSGLRPINADLKGMQLDFALDLMMFKHGLAWHTDGKEIMIGDEKAIEALREKMLMK
jgi:hypothetical protein